MPRKTAALQTPKQCQFCAIIAGELSAYVVYEDQFSIAFLDHRPLFPGHCLLVSRQHYATLYDIPKELVEPLFVNAQTLAATIQRVMQADGSFMGVNSIVSQSVPHFHVHIVPRRRGDGLRGFFWPRHKMTDEEFKAIQKTLVDGLKK